MTGWSRALSIICGLAAMSGGMIWAQARAGDGYHDSGHVYVKNETGDTSFRLAITNTIKGNSAVSPDKLTVSDGDTGTISYKVHKDSDACVDNNLDVRICAVPSSESGTPTCSSSKPKCPSGDITAECYIGTGQVEYCGNKLYCDNSSTCKLGNLPGGFSFKQGDTGANHITFKISRK
jgi:hypothetical protein